MNLFKAFQERIMGLPEKKVEPQSLPTEVNTHTLSPKLDHKGRVYFEVSDFVGTPEFKAWILQTMQLHAVKQESEQKQAQLEKILMKLAEIKLGKALETLQPATSMKLELEIVVEGSSAVWYLDGIKAFSIRLNPVYTTK